MGDQLESYYFTLEKHDFWFYAHGCEDEHCEVELFSELEAI